MKKNILLLIASCVTFLLGLGAVLFIYLQPKSIPKIASQKDLIFDLEKVCPDSQSFPGRSEKITEINKGKSGYFPSNSWNNYKTQDDFINDWYGKYLQAMKEKSLLDAENKNTEIYRFLWLRAFHHPISVRIEKNNGEVKLFMVELDGAGGYDPGKIYTNKFFLLSDENFCEFLNKLEKTEYWGMETTQSDGGLDGARWILEGVKNNRYHIVDRWTPENGKYRDACIFLLKLSGINKNRS